MLVIICGKERVGKTTVAEKIAEKIDGIIIRNDAVRDEIIENPTYSEEELQKVYDESFSRAEKLISEGKNVILDSTFTKKSNRDKAKNISDENILIEVVCPSDVMEERIKRIYGDKGQEKLDYLDEKNKRFEPVDEEHATIDTSKDIDEQIEKII